MSTWLIILIVLAAFAAIYFLFIHKRKKEKPPIDGADDFEILINNKKETMFTLTESTPFAKINISPKKKGVPYGGDKPFKTIQFVSSDTSVFNVEHNNVNALTARAVRTGLGSGKVRIIAVKYNGEQVEKFVDGQSIVEGADDFDIEVEEPTEG